jgi:hypothetical protein
VSHRVYCQGVLGAPCPFRHWWYADGPGRRIERCACCKPKHDNARRRINHQNDKWKQKTLAAEARAGRED